MHTRPKIFMFCLDFKRDNKNCSSVVTYYKVITMNFHVKAHFTKKVSAITNEVISMNFPVHAYSN